MVSIFLFMSYKAADYSYLSLLKSSTTGLLDVLIWPAESYVFPLSPLYFNLSFLLAFRLFYLLSH